MHKQVKQYCESLKQRFPHSFHQVKVLDCGSLDINGNNRYLFDESDYTGIDILEGPNVDTVTRVHEFLPDQKEFYDTIISTEMLEHDSFRCDSLWRMTKLLKPGGLLIITAAGFGREVHGTHDQHPRDSPATHDYYQNIYPEMFRSLHLQSFQAYEISYLNTDIRFWGIKRLNTD